MVLQEECENASDQSCQTFGEKKKRKRAPVYNTRKRQLKRPGPTTMKKGLRKFDSYMTD